MGTERQRQYLAAMGIDVWVRKGLESRQLGEQEDDALAKVPEVLSVNSSQPEWPALEAQVQQCELCELHLTRTQTVFGVGNRNAELMIIGEAPGAEEDRQGEPFVGRAGQLLNAMLAAIGLDRDAVFIANILKCRPPGNRNPSVEEAQSCSAYLRSQIELIQPRLILVMGRIAAQNLLKSSEAIGRMRGHKYEYGDSGTPVVVTYHPAYLLRSPKEKAKSWQDLQFACQVLDQIREEQH